MYIYSTNIKAHYCNYTTILQYSIIIVVLVSCNNSSSSSNSRCML